MMALTAKVGRNASADAILSSEEVSDAAICRNGDVREAGKKAQRLPTYQDAS